MNGVVEAIHGMKHLRNVCVNWWPALTIKETFEYWRLFVQE